MEETINILVQEFFDDDVTELVIWTSSNIPVLYMNHGVLEMGFISIFIWRGREEIHII
jgi:hypothetical protein